MMKLNLHYLVMIVSWCIEVHNSEGTIARRVAFGGQSLMFWGGMSVDTKKQNW